MLESASDATDLDLISCLRSIPDARMRRGVRFPAWYLLVVAVLGILSGCQILRDLERFAILHHTVLTEAFGLELRRPPSDSSFRYFYTSWTWHPLSAFSVLRLYTAREHQHNVNRMRPVALEAHRVSAGAPTAKQTRVGGCLTQPVNVAQVATSPHSEPSRVTAASTCCFRHS